MKTPIVFFGASHFVLPIIEFLNCTYDLRLIITTELSEKYSVPMYCKENNIPYKSVQTCKDISLQEMLNHIHAPVGVLAYFGLILPESIIKSFPKGIINIHPSLLPEYRGPTPGQTAILEGKKESGVSIMVLDKDIDHGPLLKQEKLAILPTDSAIDFYENAFSVGTNLLRGTLPGYLATTLNPTPQDDTKATYTSILQRESGFINPHHMPSSKIINQMIRAYYPWPGVYTKLSIYGKDKIVKLLPEKLIQVEGKKPMKLKDFINGYPEQKDWAEQIIKL